MDFDRDYDVLVAGAGVAGVAAALELARAGLRTALVEKGILVGGLATSGLVSAYLPLCDGCGRQVTHGIAEELLHLSIRYGPGEVPPGWRKPAATKPSERYQTRFSPSAFVLALDEALAEAGVALWLDTLVCLPIMAGDRIRGVEVENKSGRGALRARVLIDATGDADVAYRAGAPCEDVLNWLVVWALQSSLAAAQKAVSEGNGAALLGNISCGGGGMRELGPPQGGFSGTDAEQVTRFVLDSRKLLLDYYKTQYAEGVDRRDLFPVALPSMAQFRTTRRIVGRATMSAGEDGQRVPDSVGLVAEWRRSGPVWEIPYGTLVPQRVKGLLAAGRCISSEGDAWHLTRVIPCAALTGQVAGMAAALALEHNTTPDELDARGIQERLAERGMPFHISE